MNLFVRLFLILSVAMFAANSVMSCCLTGHAQASVQTEDQAPPCHGSSADDAATTDKSPDCPGCTDCGATMLQANAIDNIATPSKAQDLPVALWSSRPWPVSDAPRVVRTTGPPRSAPRIRATPLALRQRFLI